MFRTYSGYSMIKNMVSRLKMAYIQFGCFISLSIFIASRHGTIWLISANHRN
jgi:hypothetical protein